MLAVAAFVLPEVAASAAVTGRADDRRDAVRRQELQAQDDLEGTTSQLAKAYGQLAAVRRQLATLQQRAQQAASTAELARAALRRQQALLEQARSQQSVVTSQLAVARDRGEQAATQIAAVARSMYRYDDLQGLSLVLGARQAQDAAQGLMGLERISGIQRGVIAGAAAQKAEYTALVARAQAVSEQVRQATVAAQAQVLRTQQAESAARAAAAKVAAAERRQQAIVRSLQSQRAAEAQALSKLRAERQRLDALVARLAAQARARALQQRREAAARAAAQNHSGGGGAPAPSSGGVFTRPVGGYISSPFGWRIHPIYGTRRMHTGVDLANPCGTPVRAPADGQIVKAGWAGGYGYRVVIDQGAIGGSTYATTYNHLQTIVVSSGQVRRGQVIALVGTTGASTGCHLHWEVYKDGGLVDPMSTL